MRGSVTRVEQRSKKKLTSWKSSQKESASFCFADAASTVCRMIASRSFGRIEASVRTGGRASTFAGILSPCERLIVRVKYKYCKTNIRNKKILTARLS